MTFWRTCALLALLTGFAAAAPDETRLYVAGMSCRAGCAARAEEVLRALPGVVEATVDLESRQAVVRYDPRVTSPERIARGLSEGTEGRYPARVLNQGTGGNRQ